MGLGTDTAGFLGSGRPWKVHVPVGVCRCSKHYT